MNTNFFFKDLSSFLEMGLVQSKLKVFESCKNKNFLK